MRRAQASREAAARTSESAKSARLAGAPGHGTPDPHPHPHPRFAGDRGWTPDPRLAGDRVSTPIGTHPRFAGDSDRGSTPIPIVHTIPDLPESGIQLSTRTSTILVYS